MNTKHAKVIGDILAAMKSNGENELQTLERIVRQRSMAVKEYNNIQEVGSLLAQIAPHPDKKRHCNVCRGTRGYSGVSVVEEDGVKKYTVLLCCGQVGLAPHAHILAAIGKFNDLNSKMQNVHHQAMLDEFDVIKEQNIRLKEYTLRQIIRSFIRRIWTWNRKPEPQTAAEVAESIVNQPLHP